MADRYGLQDDGFFAPRALQVIEDLRADAEALAPADLGQPAWAPDTVLGALSAAIGVGIARAWDAAQRVYDAMDPRNASGLVLDGRALLQGVRRQEATRSSVTLVATPDPSAGQSAVLEPGRIVEDEGGRRWRTTTRRVISPGGLPQTVQAEALEEGAIYAGAQTITKIVTPVSGWLSVTNPEPAVPGRTRDTDAILRARIEIESSRDAPGLLRRMTRSVEAIPGVVKTSVFVNDTDAPLAAPPVPARGMRVVVHPRLSSAATQDAIAQAILDNLEAGVQLGGLEFGRARAPDGRTRRVHFAFTEPRDLEIRLTFALDPDAGRERADVEPELLEALGRAAARLGPGQDVRPLDFVVAAAGVRGVESASAEIRILYGNLALWTADPLELTPDVIPVLSDVTFLEPA